MRPRQTGHSAGPPAARSSHTPRTTSSSVDPDGWNSRIAERPVARSSVSLSLRSSVAGAFMSDPSDHPGDLAEDAGIRRADRLHRLVLGLQADVVLLAED